MTDHTDPRIVTRATLAGPTLGKSRKECWH